MISVFVPLLIACAVPEEPGSSSTNDGVAPCESDPSDANGNGKPDACERELLGSFQTQTIFLGEPSEHILVWLACQRESGLWVEVQPGMELRFDDQGPLVVETATLNGWDAFRDCSSAGGQNVGTYVRPLDYPLAYESGAGVASNIDDFEALEEDDIHEIAVKAVSWELDNLEPKTDLALYFFGAPGVR